MSVVQSKVISVPLESISETVSILSRVDLNTLYWRALWSLTLSVAFVQDRSSDVAWIFDTVIIPLFPGAGAVRSSVISPSVYSSAGPVSKSSI